MTVQDVARASELYGGIVAAILKVLETQGYLPVTYEPIIISLSSYVAMRVTSKLVKRFIPAKGV